jgi:nitrogenase molybdenum-iron protein alpha/beta subunit
MMASLPCDECATPERSCSAGFERPYRRPYLIGVYLATNAIPDAATVVDGPDCAFFKAEFIHGKHDLGSTLLDVTGRHRILVSQVTTDDLATSRGRRAGELARRAAGQPETTLVMVMALPLVTITGVPHDQIIRDLQPAVDADLVVIPGRSLQGDWLTGYEDVLTRLARRLAERSGEAPTAAVGQRAKGVSSVSVIGYLMDRNEEDHHANLRELRRLVAALGLELDSVWLSGQPWPELGRALRSDILVALPMGRPAAQAIAARSGAQVVEAELPFGLAQTERFIRALGAATGTTDRAESLIVQELEQALPRLEWAIPHYFLGKRAVLFGAPDLLGGFVQLATELGMDVIGLGCPASRPAWLELKDWSGPSPTFDVSPETASRDWWRSKERRPDIVIGNTDALKCVPADVACVELGYPGTTDHAFFDRPFLGYRGYLAFVQRMVTALATTTERARRS